MNAKLIVFSIVLMFYSGCAFMPILVGSGGTAAYFYYQEKSESVYRIPLEEAYPAAMRTLGALELEITGIEMAGESRIISSKDSTLDSRQITFTLEPAGIALTKATVRVTNHAVIPDRAYGKMVLEIFTDEVAQNLGRDKAGKILTGRR